jgi:hypothetical protein
MDRFVLRLAAKGEDPHPHRGLPRELRYYTGSGYLGAAYFDPVKCVIRVVEDTLETPHFDSTNMRRSTNGFFRSAGGLTCASSRIDGA